MISFRTSNIIIEKYHYPESQATTKRTNTNIQDKNLFSFAKKRRRNLYGQNLFTRNIEYNQWRLNSTPLI